MHFEHVRSFEKQHVRICRYRCLYIPANICLYIHILVVLFYIHVLTSITYFCILIYIYYTYPFVCSRRIFWAQGPPDSSDAPGPRASGYWPLYYPVPCFQTHLFLSCRFNFAQKKNIFLKYNFILSKQIRICSKRSLETYFLPTFSVFEIESTHFWMKKSDFRSK